MSVNDIKIPNWLKKINTILSVIITFLVIAWILKNVYYNNGEISPTPSFSDDVLTVLSTETYEVRNENIPYFTDSEKSSLEVFEIYSELDSLGRCGVAYANICQELMPTEGRESISNVKPSGWQSIKIDSVDGGWLYNRCHLIGFQLAGENANEKNLITGTRYFNVTGMLPFENQVAEYVQETDNHVLYRVTPVFQNNNLVADGVLMEAYSVEDDGTGVCFCVFVYNIQPGVEINYLTGEANVIEENLEENTTGSNTVIVVDASLVGLWSKQRCL